VTPPDRETASPDVTPVEKMASGSRTSRNLIVALVLLALCFSAGFAAGVIGDRIVLFHQGRVIPRGGVDFVTRHLVQRLDRALDLSESQEAQVQAMLDRRKKRVFGEWDNLQGRLHQEMEEAHREIGTVLTPAQRAKFDAMQRHWRGHRRGWM